MAWRLRPLFFSVFALLAACAAPDYVPGPDLDSSESIPESVDLAASDPYLAFEGLAPVALWHRLDTAAFTDVPLSPPENYYFDIDTSSPVALRETLHARIRDHTVFRYTNPTQPGDPNHKVDTWDIIALADAHPEDPAQVLDVYRNGTFERQLTGPSHDPRYDREHSWPKSLGFDAETLSNPPYSDVHHLFAAFSSYNRSRGDKPYGISDFDEERERATVENIGVGGPLTERLDSSNFSFIDVWQTWIGRRGDVSRAMFYMDVRYEGDLYGVESEPNLELTDDLDSIKGADVWRTGGVAFMGLLSVLLDWHEQDPVDDLERRRNTVVYLFQGNRNPFIDHPEWVGVIYGVDE